MIICGLDYSMNAPGVVKATLDDKLDIIELAYRGFTSVKKTSKLDDNLVFYHKDSFDNSFEKSMWFSDRIKEFMFNRIKTDGDGFLFMDKPDYCAIEGYSMNSKGLVFNIAEATMVTKLAIYNTNTPMRIYEPTAIKKFATGNGSSNKVVMDEFYTKFDDIKIDLSHLDSAVSPKEDLVDAYYVMRFLQIELKLRHGIIRLQDLSLPVIELFNRVTKAYPENILVRPFIQKSR